MAPGGIMTEFFDGRWILGTACALYKFVPRGVWIRQALRLT